ncbi:MAG: protein phosphatase 2C domain-containing protein [Peptococcaceae bacterium]|nr:protein phosphatase 2C domain-containing protein [Peptococcaceae bacterium]
MRDASLAAGAGPKKYQVCSRTDKGKVRPRNEDYHAYYIPSDRDLKEKWGSLFAVSDGVGGYAGGEAASAEAVNVLLQEYYFGDHSTRLPDRLQDAFNCTALHLFDVGHQHKGFANMQCTLTALLIRTHRYHIAHVGDSKAFLLRDGKLRQLTKDHSLVAKLLRTGLVSAEQARNHPYKHMLLRALGGNPITPVDMYSGNVLPDDVFCLVSDGVLEHATEDELETWLLEKGNSQTSLNRLIDCLNERGGLDNMTIMAVKALAH